MQKPDFRQYSQIDTFHAEGRQIALWIPQRGAIAAQNAEIDALRLLQMLCPQKQGASKEKTEHF
ncbi:MAG: hypothetical protein K5705_04525 [Oscillospiraceae bacterium]|nr:hypothetical protein [Oscillospiraceae bacterium]MCR4759520.1 hypothetical protein [Oscillospiraceae bacterium]